MPAAQDGGDGIVSEEQPLGQLLREFIATLGAYLKQNAADAVHVILAEPLKRAAKKVLLLGLALGLAIMAGVFLALAGFNALYDWLGTKTAAYSVAFGACAIAGALCAWGVMWGARRSDEDPGDR